MTQRLSYSAGCCDPDCGFVLGLTKDKETFGRVVDSHVLRYRHTVAVTSSYTRYEKPEQQKHPT